MPGISAIEQLSGATADENELLFISALHQTCLPDIRRNGTISSADIMLLMRSKYGIMITPEVAKDIALNVAGGKLVEEKQDESSNRTLLHSAMAKLVSKTEEDKIPSEDTEAESDVYFDIVQLAALLLTPNILEFSKNEDTEVFERVLSQLLEPLYDVDEEKLRSTGILDIDLLRKILVAAGDFDTANNQALMEQMIQLASNKGNFDISSFQNALTSDVAEGFNDVAVSKTSNTRATSTFFDVFGCNWEDSREEHKSEKYEKVTTWSHVDYASDSYHSYILNIIIWIQFMFGVLFYWIGLAQPFFSRRLTPTCGGFFCDILRKIIRWSLTGASMGTYGVIIICSFAYGNVNAINKKKRVLASLVCIFLYIVPFVSFLVYRRDTPHHAVVYTDYNNICPPDLVKNSTRPFVTESFCYKTGTFCRMNPTLQGKKLFRSLTGLTQEEKKRCYEHAMEYRQYNWAHHIVNGTSDSSGTCFSDKDCRFINYRGKCGHPFSNSTNKVCCETKDVVIIDGRPICSNQLIGASCFDDAVCESNRCLNNTCAKSVDEQKHYLLEACSRDKDCVSDYCEDYKCKNELTVCPVTSMYLVNATPPVIAALSGLTILPVCVTEEKFCKDNSLSSFSSTAFRLCKDELIPFLNSIKFLNVIPKNEAKELVTVVENLDVLEVALRDVIYFAPLMISGLLCCLIVPIYCFYGFDNKDNHHQDAALKSAAETKTKLLVTNALKLHKPHNSTSEMEGVTMRNYFQHDRDTVSTGGLFWILASFRSGNLFKKHGIHIPGRFIVANFAQFLTIIFMLVTVLVIIRQSAKGFDKFLRDNLPLTDEMIDSMPADEFYNLSATRILSYYVPKTFVKHLPQGSMIEQSFIPSAFIAALVSGYSAFVLIPSFIHTTLELRSGNISTFYSKRFSALRRTSDQVNSNLGSLFFSLIGCFLVITLVFGLGFLVFVLPFTRKFGITLLTLGVGIGTSMILKQLLQGQIRKTCFQALMRKDAKIGNISGIFFECWFIATAVLTVVIRLALVLVKTCVSIGRLDISFLHDDIGGDSKADTFRKEILVQEAHCHPYLDRLSGIYLRRLRDGDNFGSAAGQAWRSLFVIGMCPWLIRYRENVTVSDYRNSEGISEQKCGTSFTSMDDLVSA